MDFDQKSLTDYQKSILDIDSTAFCDVVDKCKVLH